MTRDLRPPFLLRLAALAARLVGWACLLVASCYPLARLLLTLDGQPLEDRAGATGVILLLLGLGVLLLVLATGLRRAARWVRWGAVGFWAAVLTGVGVAVPAAAVPAVAYAVLPVAFFTLGYLFFNPAVRRYYAWAREQERRRQGATPS